MYIGQVAFRVGSDTGGTGRHAGTPLLRAWWESANVTTVDWQLRPGPYGSWRPWWQFSASGMFIIQNISGTGWADGSNQHTAVTIPEVACIVLPKGLPKQISSSYIDVLLAYTTAVVHARLDIEKYPT